MRFKINSAEVKSLSFSANVKEEISQRFGNGIHCELAELSAIMNICGKISYFGEKNCLKIQMENFVVVKKCFTILKKTLNISSEIRVRSPKNGRGTRIYTLLLRDQAVIEKLLQRTGVGIYDGGRLRISNQINPLMVQSICCRRSYIRGAFLSVGSVTDPNKNYHLEFAFAKQNLSLDLQSLLYTFSLEAKIVERKEYFVVYMKEGEQIVNLLNIIEGHVALMALENVRILKEVRNDVNRKVNCETANLNKVVQAAVQQIEDISFIQNTVGLDSLSEPLQDIARLRLEYPDASLKELGALSTESVGKSGVNHRLKKISQLAEDLRKGKR
ncbi:MAG: DNA-binding protein WhiA [Bacillota bacterium]